MKRLFPFYLFTLLLLSCGVDGDKFRLEGRLRNMHMGEFWVYSTDGAINGIDTISVREGRFAYEIELRSPTTLIVIFPNYSEQPVFAEPGEAVEIKGDASHMREMVINGTDDNEEMTRLRQELNKLMPPEIPKRVEAFVRENPQSEVSVYLVQRYFMQENPDYKKANELVKLMIAAQPNNGRLIKWRKELPDLSSGQTNSRLKNFSAKDVKGRVVTQQDLMRKVNVVTAWATWNYQSIDMQRRLQKLKEDYGEKLGVVSICLDGRPADVKQRVERDSVPWKTVCDGRLWQSPLLAQFGIADVPTCLVINGSGTIVARDLAPDKLEEKIKQMLK